MGEDNSSLAVVRGKPASESRAHAQHREERGGHSCDGHLLSTARKLATVDLREPQAVPRAEECGRSNAATSRDQSR